MSNRIVARRIMEKVASRRNQESQLEGMLKEAYEAGVKDGIQTLSKKASMGIDMERAQYLVENPPNWGEMSPNERKLAIATILGVKVAQAVPGAMVGAGIGTLASDNKLKGGLLGGLIGGVATPLALTGLSALRGNPSLSTIARASSRATREALENKKRAKKY